LNTGQFLTQVLNILAKLATAEGIKLRKLSVWVWRLTDELFASPNPNDLFWGWFKSNAV